ncbi:MAG: hypothetical protein ACRET4_04480 [Steroidobacteraceae bacterium]
MRSQAFTLALIIAAASSGQARAALTTIEEAIEATTRSVSLPANEQGVIIAKPCPACAPIVLRMTAATRMYVDKSPVSLPQLQKFIATGGERNMVVLYDPRVRTLTRILVSGDRAVPSP